MAAPSKNLADYKAPYPEPGPEEKRVAIFLDPKGSDKELCDYRVELMPGRVELVDGANRHMLGGHLEEKTVEGWGYPYYKISLGPTMGTLMMPLGDEAEKRPTFVRLHGEANLVRYNSKLPIVALIPKNAELRYRIWTVAGGSDTPCTAEEH